MNKRSLSLYRMVAAAMIAALYTAVSLTLAPLSFGVVQIRFSEALGLLAVFSPVGVWGVTLGCLISNAVGVALGATMPADIVFGTLATLIAALLSYRLRNLRVRGLPVWSALPPILVNAVVIGFELTWFYYAMEPGFLIMNMLAVAAGQILPCAVLGLLLVWSVERAGLDKKLFAQL